MDETTEAGAPVKDERIHIVELMVSHLLRGGVVLSFVIVAAGIVMLVATSRTGYGNVALDNVQSIIRYHGGHPDFPHSLPDVCTGLLSLKPYAVISLGLLVLIATPVVRVAVTVVAFIVERDWTYVIVTGFVFVVLLLSFALGKAG